VAHVIWRILALAPTLRGTAPLTASSAGRILIIHYV
jgi:hypothetical protein